MSKTKTVLYTMMMTAALLLTACTVDPRKQAAADATRLEAETLAADAQQRREQQAEIHEQNMQDRESAQAQWQTSLNAIIRTGTLAAQFTVVIVMLAIGVAGVWSLYGTTKAYNRYVEIRANLIPLDPRTHQYPLLLQYIGKGLFSLTNPNDNSVLLLDTRNDPDREKIQSSANVLWAGELGHQARLSHRPGEITSMTAPQVIDMESER